MAATPPVTVDEFKVKFERNFIFGAGLETVRNTDIEGAFDEAMLLYNPALWSISDGKQAFLYAAAHLMVTNIQASGGTVPVVTGEGVINRSQGIIESKSVGQVSVKYTPPPERLRKLSFLLPFWETEYGKRYVMMLLPKLSGNVGVVSGPREIAGIPPIPFVGP